MLSSNLHYAETHFKFKLPWSPLFRKEPEILVDAPYQVLQQENCPFFLIVKDAHLYPRILKSISYTIQSTQETQTFQVELNWTLEKALDFLELPIELPSRSDHYTINVLFNVETLQGKSSQILNWNYRGIPPMPLQIHRLSAERVLPLNWSGGEMHCHTSFTSDPVEFGADPKVFHKSARACGLDFVTLTDHSYNFAYDTHDYMREISPKRKWDAMTRCLQNLPSEPHLLQGEEISCGNSLGQNIHMLGLGIKEWVPGLGDGGRRWLNNKPDLSIEEVLEANPQATFFAAHPKSPIGKLEQALFNRGIWSQDDLHSGVRGLQFWNGARDRSFYLGRAFWVQQLLKRKRILPIGGNDAHGDLNRAVAVKTPLFSLKAHRGHTFGRVKTVLPTSDCSTSSLQKHFREDRLFCTDGPHILMPEDNSTPAFFCPDDYGLLSEIRLYRGYCKQGLEKTQVFTLNTQHWQEPQDWKNADYLRWECLSTQGHFALSSAQWKNNESN